MIILYNKILINICRYDAVKIFYIEHYFYKIYYTLYTRQPGLYYYDLYTVIYVIL